MSLKALTLRHPWAFAVAFLQKNVENREWSDELARLNNIHGMVGEQVAIHGGAAPVRPKSGKHWSKLAETNLWRQHCEALEYLSQQFADQLTPAGGAYLTRQRAGGPLKPEHFILPGIVAVATVERVTRTSQSAWSVPGRLHIELSQVMVLPSAVQATGKQGLWTLDAPTEQAVREQLSAWSRRQVPTAERLDRLSAAEILR